MTKRKRGQKEGSIFQRANDGRWVGTLSLGAGQRRSVYARTAAEVRAKLDDLRKSVEEGRTVFDDSRTVEVLFNEWLEAKKGTVRPKTLESYKGLVRRHVIPVLGRSRLSKLGAVHLERLYRSKSEHLSPKTVRNLHFVIEAALNWAVRRDWISRNPASLITSEELPRVRRKETKVLSVSEANELMNAAKNTKSEALIRLGLETGARVGELTGITWDQVDFDAGKVRIKYALQFLDGQPTLVEPKTSASVRELSISPNAIGALKSQLARQSEQAIGLGKAWTNDLNLVFTTEIGGPLNRHAVLRQYLRPLLREAGLPESIRFHDLRHGAASLLLARGVPIPVVSELLGHANPSITMSIYSHALPNSQEMVAEAMESVFGN